MKKTVREVIVVEGRYDKNALSQVVDAAIVTLGGFAVFNDREKLSPGMTMEGPVIIEEKW